MSTIQLKPVQNRTLPGRHPLPHIVDQHVSPPPHLRGSVMALGNFDGLHLGHERLLGTTRRLAANLAAPVAIMSCEPHPRQLFNPSGPAFRLMSRVGKVLAFGRAGIDLLFEPRFDHDYARRSPADFVDRLLHGHLAVRAVVVGSDFHFGAGRSGSVTELADLGRNWGIEVVVVEDFALDRVRLSSSLIRQWIAEGDLTRASRALSDHWLMTIAISADGGANFDTQQVLPPPGTYQIELMDRDGRFLGHELVTLSQDRRGYLATSMVPPGHHLIFGWRRADMS